jgi:hypothetical protein
MLNVLNKWQNIFFCQMKIGLPNFVTSQIKHATYVLLTTFSDIEDFFIGTQDLMNI